MGHAAPELNRHPGKREALIRDRQRAAASAGRSRLSALRAPAGMTAERIRSALGAVALGALALSASVAGAAPSEPRAVTDPAGPASPVVVRHEGTFNGKRLAYDSIVEPIDVADASGKPGARVVGISYVAANAGDPAKRPVLFVFNGGPIGPSAIVHMGAFGPKRVAIPDDLHADPAGFKTVDNPYTVLDAADIVFFDPASTGWSRVAPGVDPTRYFSVDADAQQLAQFIVQWCKAHGRTASPKYVLGESYGTMRAAAVANQLQKLPEPMALNGVVLLGQALNIIEFSQRPTNVTSYVASLPTLAAIAWSHGVADLKGRSFEQFEADVETFGRTDYLTALYQGSSLDEATRRRTAERLQEFTGIPADWYVAHGLRISKELYRRELFRSKGLILGMTDGRYAGPVDAHGGGEPAGVIPAAYEKAFEVYAHSSSGLGLGEVGPYVEQDPVAGLDGWNWGHGASPFSDWPYPALLAEVFKANPGFRVMVGNGWEDTQTTVGGARLLLDQSGWPRERTSLHVYQGGHMSYSVEDSLKRMTSDVRAFIEQR
jgi:carboxypeptidase C (cathepsin A)